MLLFHVEMDVGAAFVADGIPDEYPDAVDARRDFRVRHVDAVWPDERLYAGGEVDVGRPFVDDGERVEVDLGVAMRFELYAKAERRLDRPGFRRRVNGDDIEPAFDPGAPRRWPATAPRAR